MARTKQTARKNTGEKIPAMKPKPKPGQAPKADPKKPPWADRKVIIEYSSDESFDEDKPQPVQGTGAPKRIVKQIHLTLPTSPTHVTTTESFMTFFINHGLTKALKKAFQKRGWSTDQMQELMANFQHKHSKKIPLPKIYMDEDDSDSEGLELEDGTRVGRKATGGSSSGGKPGRKPSAGGAGGGTGTSGGGGTGGTAGGVGTSGSGGAEGSTDSAGGSGPGRGSKCSHEDDDPEEDPNKRRKMDDGSKPARRPIA